MSSLRRGRGVVIGISGDCGLKPDPNGEETGTSRAGGKASERKIDSDGDRTTQPQVRNTSLRVVVTDLELFDQDRVLLYRSKVVHRRENVKTGASSVFPLRHFECNQSQRADETSDPKSDTDQEYLPREPNSDRPCFEVRKAKYNGENRIIFRILYRVKGDTEFFSTGHHTTFFILPSGFRLHEFAGGP
jgi:hypothetical protein